MLTNYSGFVIVQQITVWIAEVSNLTEQSYLCLLWSKFFCSIGFTPRIGVGLQLRSALGCVHTFNFCKLVGFHCKDSQTRTLWQASLSTSPCIHWRDLKEGMQQPEKGHDCSFHKFCSLRSPVEASRGFPAFPEACCCLVQYKKAPSQSAIILQSMLLHLQFYSRGVWEPSNLGGAILNSLWLTSK